MTELDEKLAYLLDDQPGGDDRATVDEAIDDVNLQYRLRRHRIIGEAMRHELPPTIDIDFHHTVMARIRAEATVAPAGAVSASPSKSSLLQWARLKPFAGVAVAASAALVTVSLWQPLQESEDPAQPETASAEQLKIQQIAKSLDTGNAVPASLGTRWKLENDAPELQQKLNAYLVNHTEYSNSMQGLIPQARVAGFDAQQ